ncbi:MAG TPA: ABC transporter permease [Vicinamibacterales bacterium]|nr:ABC transporter permease [Vicinamibacterales bacterium]
MSDPSAPAVRDRLRPAWEREVRMRLSSLRLSPPREAEIVEELSDHLHDHWHELIAGGASEEDAMRIVLAEFRGNLLPGYLAALRQSNVPPASTPGSTTGRLSADAWQDLRYAARTLSRQPGFALLTVLTLALGIGANSAIFTVVRGVLLASLPFDDAERLYRLRMVYPDGSAQTTLSAPDFMSVREQTRVFDRVEAYTAGTVTMLGGGDAREVRVVSVSDGLFELLGLRVAHGRPYAAEEHAPGRNGVAILDHGFWQRVFGGDDGAIGRAISVGGIPYSIVGVLAPGARLPADVPGARLPSDADLYLPIAYGEAFSATTVTGRRSRFLGVLARASTGVSPAAIDEDLRRIALALRTAFPQPNEVLTMNAISARELIVGDVRAPLLVLLGAVGFVLLVACANVASLILARASARQEELTVRAALGAGRGRLLRQLLTEAIVLGLMGGTIGLALASAGTHALVAARPTDIPRLEEIRPDWVVLFFTFGITLLASLAFGATPALQVTGRLARGLRAGGRGGGADRQTQHMRAALVVAEVAVAVVLLVGAGLLLRSLMALTRVAPGFAIEDAMAFRVALFGRGYDPLAVRTRVSEIEAELRAIPGVTAAAATSVLPLSGPGPRLAFAVEVAPPPPSDVNPEIGVASVTPEYFRSIGARLVLGRDFTSRDGAEAPPVAIINESALRRWFPDGKPIGRRVRMDGVREVIGVVGDMLQGDPKRQAAPQLFLPHAQRPTRSVSFVVRTAGVSVSLAPSVHATMSRIDASIAMSDLQTLEQLRARSVARPRFYTALLTLFAGVALALAATGIFGVMTYVVAERTREIGVRMALGAQSADVLRMIVGQTLVLAAAGMVIGLAGAFVVGPVIHSQLFGVEFFDPATVIVVGLMLLSSAALASFLPARRAARLDPCATLRQG